MKNGVVVVVVAGALLLSASGSMLAAGGLGSVGGSDGFQMSYPEQAQDDAVTGGVARPVALGAKVGGGSDRPAARGGKIAIGGGGD